MSPTILIADGQLAVRQIIQQALRKNGYRTVMVDSAHDALTVLNETHIHGIILEDELVDTSGGQLCRQIKTDRTTRHIPVILTGQSLRVTNPDYVEATQANIAFLKPIAAEKIVEALSALVMQTL